MKWYASYTRNYTWKNAVLKVTPADQGLMINNEIGCIQNIISNKCETNNVIYQVYQIKEFFFIIHYHLQI